MAYSDLREWIKTLEDKSMLRRVKAEVDWDREVGAVCRTVTNKAGPALLFENIKGHSNTFCKKLFVNGMGHRERVALAVGLHQDTPYKEIVRTIRQRFENPIPPVVVKTGPVKQNIRKGSDIDLNQVPVPKWHHLDGGRYINTSCAVVTRDPDTGALNVGTYRGMIVEKDTIGVLLASTQHWGMHFAKWRAKGKPMPVAVVYGWDPALQLVSSAPLVHRGQVSEYDICGGLRQAAVELVKCETSDLVVPATAELVVEGHISHDPASFRSEGPFGEYPGYYGGKEAPKPVIKVDCITHRDDPIYRGVMEGSAPGKLSESGYYVSASWCAAAWLALESAGVPGVLDVWAPLVVIGTTVRVRIKKQYRGHAKQIANALWGSPVSNYMAKTVIVVDEDIDIFDDEAMEWAMAYRLNPDMGDIQFFPGTFGSMLDPSTPLDQRDIGKYGQGKWNRTLVDATINWELERQAQYGNERYPPLATEIEPEDAAVLARRWKEYGID